MDLQVDPALSGSLRTRILASNATARSVARILVRAFPSLLFRVNGAYSGPIQLTVGDARFGYLLGPSDPIGEVLYWLGEQHWEREVIPTFCKLVRQAQGHVLDIGANFGVYSLVASRLNPDLRVIAWEPVPFVHERLKGNVAENGLEARIECRQKALADASGVATFYTNPDATMGSLVDHYGSGEPIQVQIESVDEALAPEIQVGLVKIDVEGHERRVFEGMQRILSQQRPPIIFECLNQDLWDPIAELLSGLDYRFSALTAAGPETTTSFRSGVTNYLAQAL